MDPKAMYKLTYGLFVLTTKGNGCIVNTAIQAASNPNQLTICVNKANYTHDLILENKAFNVSVISEKASFDLFKRFGFQSGRDVNKFDGFTGFNMADNGIAYITEGCNAYFICKVTATLDLGSHTLFVGEISDMNVLSEDASTTYLYYLNHIKPKPEAKKTTQTVWRCKICGYEYVGEVLPEDFICPICKHPASDFEKVE